MANLTNPDTGHHIVVPDGAVASYLAHGWVRPGAPVPNAEVIETAEPAEVTASPVEATPTHGVDEADSTEDE